MKKGIFTILLMILIASCSSDDDTVIIEETVETENSVIRITEVNADTDQITLANLGDSTQNIGDYWLCLGPGTYVQVSDAASGSTNLNPNQSITLSYNVDVTADGLSLFSVNTFGSTDPDVLIDYVQWGAGNQARVDQAVTAGRWDNASNFVTMGSPYTFTGNATQFGSTFWQGTQVIPAGNAIIRISTVDATEDQVTLANLGDASLDIGTYWLCLGPGTYVQVSNATSGATNLEPNQSITLSYDVDPTADGLSLFTVNTFGSTDPDVLIDYVQWGAGNQARVDQAVTAGRWDNAANFVEMVSPYTFSGSATDFGSTFWQGTQAAPANAVIRIARVNTAADEVTLTNLGNTTLDIADYWLCLGPGTYVQVSNATTASTNLGPDQSVVLNYDVNPTADGLSIFSVNSFGSSDPDVLIDYVQWGAPNQARVDQAVTAGRWDAVSNIAAGASPYIFNGNATNFGSTFWN